MERRNRMAWMIVLPLLAQCQAMQSGPESLRFNEIQFLGSHNSYKARIDPPLLERLRIDNAATAASLDYAHLPLEDQLDLGLRKVELDVYYDPAGGRYTSPLGIRVIPNASPYDPDGQMKRPGFKVFHVQDIDFRSHCPLLVDCLERIRSWSDAHEGHLPIVITVNAKDDVIDVPGFVAPLPFTGEAWQALDDEIRSAVGSRLLIPDDIRRDRPTLREAVLDGWPRLEEVRGRILFVLDDAAEKKASYLRGHPSLAGRVMFVDVPEDHPAAAIRIVNDPRERGDYITSLVRQGFIVRTRADADTREARSGDDTRFRAALESGAQIISTDYYVEDERFGTGYRVSLGEGVVARCNPVSAGRECTISAGD